MKDSEVYCKVCGMLLKHKDQPCDHEVDVSQEAAECDTY